MAIFKVTAQGDTLYIQADSLEQARERLFSAMGAIPDNLLSWRQVKKLPPGEEYL